MAALRTRGQYRNTTVAVRTRDVSRRQLDGVRGLRNELQDALIGGHGANRLLAQMSALGNGRLIKHTFSRSRLQAKSLVRLTIVSMFVSVWSRSASPPGDF
jgi:hypothetical protein